MSNPKKSDSGCFTGVLCRLVCQGSLQTHPSDQITEVNEPELYEQKEEPKPEAKIQAPGSPGIVAKLMGLESLPESNWVPKGKTPDSIPRSRSVNFMDYLLEFNAAQAQQHCRVRTSVSFREVPTPLHQQNHDLFVQYLDEVEDKKRGSKVRKSAVDLGHLKQRKEEKSKSKKENTIERMVTKKENQGNRKKVAKFIDEPRRVSAKQYSKINNCEGAKDLGVVLPGKKHGNRETGAILKKKIPVKSGHQKEVLVKGAVSKKSKNLLVIEDVKPAEAECSSENSSPVSILDVIDFSIYDETPFSAKEWSSLDLNSRWKSTLKTMNCDCPTAHFTQISSKNNYVELSVMKKMNYESMDNIQYIDYYVEIVAKLRKFTEAAIMQSYWMPEKVLNFEDLEEMCMEFGQHILDVLLQEFIDELVGFIVESCVNP